jgi:hypothetical protein
MDEDKKRVMHECSKGSLEDGLSFPDVVARLARIGCEQYHADFRRREKTYYMLTGKPTLTPCLSVRSRSRRLSQPIGSSPLYGKYRRGGSTMPNFSSGSSRQDAWGIWFV